MFHLPGILFLPLSMCWFTFSHQISAQMSHPQRFFRWPPCDLISPPCAVILYSSDTCICPTNALPPRHPEWQAYAGRDQVSQNVFSLGTSIISSGYSTSLECTLHGNHVYCSISSSKRAPATTHWGFLRSECAYCSLSLGLA